jgi:hypothetical protein
MLWKRIRIALLAGALVATTALSARAQDEKKDEKKDEIKREEIKAPKEEGQPITPHAAAPCAPPMQKVCVTEWVPETYQTKRTVYRTECREETYTAYRCETVMEKRVRTVCVSVPHLETRTVMRTHWTCRPVTTVERKCVDRGHYECREVPCEPGLMDRLRKCFKKNDCCADCCPPPTKTVKVWVPCMVWEERPVTRMERVCEQRPETITVTVCRTETRQETCDVPVTRQVPYLAKRTVNVCVPHEEVVTATRMVCRTVEKLVPVETCNACCEAVTCCKPSGRWFSRLTSKLGGGCCD